MAAHELTEASVASLSQSELDFSPPDKSDYPPKFWRWYEKNKHVYTEFEKLALEMAGSGRKRYSARAIVQVMRWNTEIVDSEKEFKINNNYTPGLARMFMQRHGKRYPKFFDIRSSQSGEQK